MKDLKYLTAYLIPLSAILALYLQGWWSFATVILAFGIIPALEPFLPRSQKNLSVEESVNKKKDRYFDWLLYLNLPLVYGILLYFLFSFSSTELAGYEITGLILSVGIVIGTSGINVGHELGHRLNSTDRFLAKALLLPALYMHFHIEHNRGHHKYVSTDEDPASAKKGEWIFTFWIRSLFGGYRNAWKHEAKRLKKKNASVVSLKNEMIRFLIIQITYLALIFGFFGLTGLAISLGCAFTGVLLLESINYIEHYGLRRQVLPNGSYERVNPTHSWNANYELGRIMLYELTRHSDHHYIASKKYQLLDHHYESPELPLGYPAAMLLAMVPPLWFNVMDQRIEKYHSSRAAA
ncbi:MAG: alkane 1-monooxygenase [Chitinophagales bacterium]|nr:alkane 1-monooxygenase [Chitinophagales bacterium]